MKERSKKTKIRRGKDKKMTAHKVCCGTPLNQLPASKMDAYNNYMTQYLGIPKEPDFWETDIEVVKSCGVLNHEVSVFVSPMVKQKINLLMQKFDRMEWLAYLVGDKATNTITDIVIPKQSVTSVRVNVEGDVGVPIIGVIHSHHDMGNKFSHTDDEYINGNHDISLCISKGGINGQVRVKTECGRYSLVKAHVMDNITEFDPVEFLKVVDNMITEKSVTVYGSIGDVGNLAGLGIGKSQEAAVNSANDLLDEIDSYTFSLHGAILDEHYIAEMDLLVNLINSIGTEMYDYWENKAFSDGNNICTEDYYKLVDEISINQETLTERESVALNRLAFILKGKIDTEILSMDSLAQ
jgi:hypothetical protein